MVTMIRAAAILCLVSAASLPAQEKPTDVRAAIADGQSTRKLEGYRIAKRATVIKSAIAVEVGRAYTPHLRIALAARNARDTYKAFTEADVTAEMSEPVVVIVVPPQGSKEGTQAVDSVIALPKGEKDPAKVIRPVWSKPNDITWQNIFGAVWTSTGMLAAFPLSTMDGKHEFVAIYAGKPAMGGGPGGREIRGELIDKDWK